MNGKYYLTDLTGMAKMSKLTAFLTAFWPVI